MSTQIRYRRLSAAAVLLLSLLLPSTACPVTHTIDDNSDLPYTVSVNNDTVIIATDGLVAAGRILTINGGVTGAYIKGDHLTTYGANVDQGVGTLFMILDGGTNTTIENWKIRQVYPAVNDSVQAIRIGGSIGHHYDSVSVFVCGYESQCIYTDGAGGINVEYGHWASASNAFLSRESFTAAVMWFNDNSHVGGYYDGGVIAQDVPFRTRVYGVTIDSCPFSGIVARGNGITIIDSNTIYMQTHNDRYSYPSGDMMHGAANCFAIVVGRNVPGHDGYASQISRNTVRALGGSGSARAKEGGNGIAAGGSYLTLAGAMRVWGNDVRIAQGPDDYYGYGIPSQAFKTEEALDTLLMYDNYFEAYADVSDATTDINRMANTIWLAESGADSYWRIFRNHVLTGVDGHIGGFDVGTNVYALAIESEITGADIQFYDNYWGSNCVPIHWGSRNGLSGSELVFMRDTVDLISPGYTDGSGYRAPIVLSDDAIDNYFLDCVFPGDSVAVSNGTPAEVTFQKSLVLNAENVVGLGVPDARVRVRNSYGVSVLLDNATDANGDADSGVVTIRYWDWGVGPDSTFGDFVISAIRSTDSVGASGPLYIEAPSRDTITLGNTLAGLLVATPANLAGVTLSNSIIAAPRSKVETDGAVTRLYPTQDAAGEPAWVETNDGGETWQAITGELDYNTDYHLSTWRQPGIGDVYTYPNGTTGQYFRFIADSATTVAGAGVLRTLNPTGGQTRAAAYILADTAWVAIRSTVNPNTQIWIMRSVAADPYDHFTSGTYSTYTKTLTGSPEGVRVGLFPDGDGVPVLYTLQYNGSSNNGYAGYRWQGTDDVFDDPSPNTQIETYAKYNDRYFRPAYAAGRHLLYGYATATYLSVFDCYQATSGGTWTRTEVSRRSSPGDQAGVLQQVNATSWGDVLFVFLNTTASNDASFWCKAWTPDYGYTVDSVLITGADVVSQDIQVAPSITQSETSFILAWKNTSNAARYTVVKMATESTPEAETVSTPDPPDGPALGDIGESLTYSTTGSTSSLGHSIEYRFDWDDGSFSDWLSSPSSAHSWSVDGIYVVKAQARCAAHTDIVSTWSLGSDVVISDNPAPPVTRNKVMIR